eukprot:Colp12_sorted_trinity150504_noHs@11623
MLRIHQIVRKHAYLLTEDKVELTHGVVRRQIPATKLHDSKSVQAIARLCGAFDDTNMNSEFSTGDVITAKLMTLHATVASSRILKVFLGVLGKPTQKGISNLF